MVFSIFLLVASLFILVKSADVLVDGASSFAKRLGAPPLVIGLTIVAFGTSAPELAVNISSALHGVTDVAVANILGSNIANVLLILGIVACIGGVKVAKSTIWKEIPFMALSGAVLMVLAADVFVGRSVSGVITMTDGLMLLFFFLLFLYYSYGVAKNGKNHEKIKTYSSTQTVVMMIAGFLGLIVSGKFFVDSAVDIATILGVTERVIGLTVVAIGTSLPELMTSLVAARKGRMNLAVGNVVGSNIFNVFFVLGTTALVAPLPVSAAMFTDVLIAVLCSILVFAFLFIGKRHAIERWQGGVMVLGYALYIAMLVFVR